MVDARHRLKRCFDSVFVPDVGNRRAGASDRARSGFELRGGSPDERYFSTARFRGSSGCQADSRTAAEHDDLSASQR
jgi:hypothetical protein